MPTEYRSPNLAEVIRQAIERRLMDVYVSMPGIVQSFDPVTQTCTVQPVLRKTVPDPSGTDKVLQLPPLQRVPVVFFGSGGWRITVPVVTGDTVLLVFSDRSLDRWKGNGAEGDPGAPNLHGITDAIAIVGLVPPVVPRTAPPTDRMSIGKDGGTANIEVLPARLNLGVGASQAFVLGGQFSTHMGQLATAATALQAAATALSAACTPLMLPPSAAAGATAATAAATAAGQIASAATSLASDISATVFGVP